jgi:hypothetical protein
MKYEKLRNKKTLTYLAIVILGSIIYLSILTFNKADKPQLGNSSEKLNSSRIISDLFRNGGLIIYPSSDNSKSLLKLATKLGLRFRNKGLRIASDSAFTKNELENSNIILIGSYQSNKIFQLLNDKLPVNFENDKFRFLNKTYAKPSDLIDFIYPNPFNNRKALIIISGNSDSLIAADFAFNFSGDLRIRDGYETLLLTNFVQGADNKWKIDNNNFRNFGNQIDTILVKPNYTYISHSSRITKKEVEAIAVLNENSIVLSKRLFGASFKQVHINYNLYDSFEEKGLIIGSTQSSDFNESDESVHSVINTYIQGDDFGQDAILLLRKNFGIPKLQFLETGMSVYLSRNWKGFDYKYWASKLLLSDNIPALSELLDNDKVRTESNLLTQPLAGTFAEFLILKLGINKLMKLYSGWLPENSEISSLNKEWLDYLSNLSKNYVVKIKEEQKKFPSGLPEFLKGFSYAHTGYDIYNGYLSNESFNSLKKLKKIGVNAISIMPYTSIRNPNEPEPLSFWQSAFAENDESLIYLKEVASELNFTVMLKPQIWLRRGWPGDIKMNSKSDWDRFFNDYYKWIRHYALLAEMYNMPILCIGNELSKTTLGHENKWIEMTEHIRKIYGGKITYGANWDGEFEKLNFWKNFDFIGLSQYFPLSEKENASDADLQAGAISIINRIESVSKTFNIPVLFTEIGYKGSKEPWKTALENNVQMDPAYIEQGRCYEAMLKASYGKEWLKGMFWWKWPSYLNYDDPEKDYYIPLNKPAEKIVEKWYSKKWN